MKKLLPAMLLALGLMAAGQQQAFAWSKYTFGVGLNVAYEGGGNSVLWGMFKGAQSHDMGDYGGGHTAAPPVASARPTTPASVNRASYQDRAQQPQPSQQPAPAVEYDYPSYWYGR